MASKKSSKKRQKVRVKFQLFLSLVLILGGLGLVFFAGTRGFDLSLKNQEPSASVVEVKSDFAKIKSINIPKIKRELTVSDGSFVNGRWEVAAEGVSFYTDSNLPDEGGNTVLYGHNKTRILGGLVDMKEGDRIELKLNNDKVLQYEVSEVKTIKPSEVGILDQTEEHRLTIYTCTGFLDSARFVVFAKLVS